MAVEAPHNHTNLFPSHLLTNREMMKPNHQNQMDGAMGVPSTMPEQPLFSFYQSINKSDSGLTFQNNITLPRKRSRNSISQSPNTHLQKTQTHSPFLHHHLLHHLHDHHSQIDTFIAQHMEKVRVELEEQRVRQSRTLLCVIQDAVSKKLKEKDEEIERITKLNWVLQERVKSLTAENEVWRELAQTNEAAANSLRSNLEQVLAAHVSDDHHGDDDAESSCGSNDYPDAAAAVGGRNGGDAVVGSGRMCKKCGVRESIVLLLPCRHLCLCTMCGSTIRNCPLCHSGINASVHVNFS